MFKLFLTIISEHIEYLPKEEVHMCQAKGAMEEKIDDILDERIVFDAYGDGMALKALKSKLTKTSLIQSSNSSMMIP